MDCCLNISKESFYLFYFCIFDLHLSGITRLNDLSMLLLEVGRKHDIIIIIISTLLYVIIDFFLKKYFIP